MSDASNLTTVSFCASFFSILYILYLLYWSKVNTIFAPNSSLPASVANLFGPSLGLRSIEFVNPLAPWTSTEGQKVVRQQLKCKSAMCANSEASNRAYVNVLPVLQDPENMNGQWSEYSNAWNLKTSEHFLTQHNSTYPLATVIIIPESTPDNVKFLIDDSLVPSETLDNLLNVTGQFANAFIISNNSNHTLYFTRSQETSGSENTYWSLNALSKTLVWPAEAYSESNKLWLAHTLLTNELEGAYAAEILMFNRL